MTSPIVPNGSQAPPVESSLFKPSDFTWHDQLINLLHLGASLEHRLMVQYLYAAYSLGGDQVPSEHRPMVNEWRDSFLAVAREEMAHLLTVQNVLTLLGAGFNLEADHFPWRFAWYPVEPLSLGSLACYVCAEMPEKPCTDFDDRQRQQVLGDAAAHLQKIDTPGKNNFPFLPVAEVYAEIMKLLADEERIPDVALHSSTYSYQTSFDEWGRWYRPAPRQLDPDGNLLPVTIEADRAAQFESHLLIDRVCTRTQALDALHRLSEQGEGANTKENLGEWTHFRRFHKIYLEYRQHLVDGVPDDKKWSPARPIPTRPNTNSLDQFPEGYISNRRTRPWADLFNIRYRMLLTFLMHTYQIAPKIHGDEPNLRAMVMHRVFGEMYHIKTLAARLVLMPQHEQEAPGAEGSFAGPPFELPRNLRIPMADVDCWCLHLDILEKSRSICDEILAQSPAPDESSYLQALLHIDEQTQTWIRTILAGLNSNARYAVR